MNSLIGRRTFYSFAFSSALCIMGKHSLENDTPSAATHLQAEVDCQKLLKALNQTLAEPNSSFAKKEQEFSSLLSGHKAYLSTQNPDLQALALTQLGKIASGSEMVFAAAKQKHQDQSWVTRLAHFGQWAGATLFFLGPLLGLGLLVRSRDESYIEDFKDISMISLMLSIILIKQGTAVYEDRNNDYYAQQTEALNPLDPALCALRTEVPNSAHLTLTAGSQKRLPRW